MGHARRRTWHAKRQSPQEWCTEHVNQMKWTIKTAVKWDVFLFAFIGPLLAIIGHYWSLFSSYYRIVYAQMFCRTFTILSILKFAVGQSWHWCRFRWFVAIVCRSSPVRGSHVAGSRPCRLSEFTPNRASQVIQNYRETQPSVLSQRVLGLLLRTKKKIGQLLTGTTPVTIQKTIAGQISSAIKFPSRF